MKKVCNKNCLMQMIALRTLNYRKRNSLTGERTMAYRAFPINTACLSQNIVIFNAIYVTCHSKMDISREEKGFITSSINQVVSSRALNSLEHTTKNESQEIINLTTST